MGWLPPECAAPRRAAWFEGGGPSLRYAEAGAGPVALVLIHELGGGVASWAGVLDELDPSWRWLAYDQRGHGESEKVRETFGLADQVDDLERLLDARAVALPRWLIAAAAGAAIAVEYALRHPRQVSGIVLCAPALGADRDRRAALRQRADVAARSGMRAIVDPALARSWPPALRDDTPALERHRDYRARMLANDPVSYALAARALGDVDFGDRLRSLTCPCLILAGTHDLQRPAEGLAAVAREIPGATFETVDLGHLMAVQDPARVAARIAAFVRQEHP
jgi:3-oxoadipate enol-lactonase